MRVSPLMGERFGEGGVVGWWWVRRGEFVRGGRGKKSDSCYQLTYPGNTATQQSVVFLPVQRVDILELTS